MDGKNEEKKSLSFWQIVGSTFAAAIGVQSYKNRQRDFNRGSSLAFVFSGVIFTIGFVVVVLFVVGMVVQS